MWGLETSPVLTVEGPVKPGKEETQWTERLCPTFYPSSAGGEMAQAGQTSLWAQSALNGRENLIAMSGASPTPFSRISKQIHNKACVTLWTETSALPQLGCFINS